METQSIGKLIPKLLFPYAQQWAERSGMTMLSKLLEDEHFLALVETYGNELATRTMAPKPPFAKSNGHRNGHVNGYSNGNGNGHSNGHVSGFSNGNGNGHSNGHVDGFSNGNGNGNGHSNGHVNEHSNGNGYGNNRVPVSQSSDDAGADEDAAYLSRLQDRLSTLEIQHGLQQAMFDELRHRVRPLAQALGCCPECFVGVIGCQRCEGRSSVGTYAPDEVLLEEQVIKPLAARGVHLRLRETKTAVKRRQPGEPTKRAKEI